MTDLALYDNLTDAIGAHGAWKFRLRAAIRKGADEALVAQAGDHHGCAFGRWLDSLPSDVRLEQEASETIVRHAAFHRAASRAAQLIKQGRPDAAGDMLEADFTQASQALTAAVSRWRMTASR